MVQINTVNIGTYNTNINIKVYYDNGRNLEDKGYLYHERKSLYTGMNNAYR